MDIKNFKPTPSQRRILDSHNHAMNRRDFMGLGLKSFAGMMLAQPLLSQWAHAASPELPPFMVFDLVGGAALSGNFLVGGKGGSLDLLSSYSLLGYDPRAATMDDRFGLPAPKDISRLFEGMISVMSPGAQAAFKMTGIAHQSVDDVSSNVTSTLGLVAKYWQQNERLSQKGLGTRGTNSGGNTKLSLDDASIRPEYLSDVTQLSLLSGLGYIRANGYDDATLKKFVERQKNQFVRQYKSLASKDQLGLKDQYEKHFDTVLGSMKKIELDPRNLPETQQIFGINKDTGSQDINALAAGIANTSFSGMVGPSCIALGGYDYHDGTQQTGDNADFIAGQTIGRVIELAHQKKTPFFFQVLTDGSCSAVEGTREWGADSGDRSMTLMGSYSPDGVKQQKTQLGHYTEGQIAELDTYVGRRTDNVARVVFLNYLSSMGKEAEIRDYVPEAELPQAVIDDALAFTL